MTEANVDIAVERVVALIDTSTLLGAAYDCMSDRGKTSFQQNLRVIIADTLKDPE